ncbi:DUF4870 domain-containing protein [Sinomonas sp. JGH33]|uniref:DUF4870 domain-containing protein n=1 Tax=Sinomonas terricola TaxID=3110330 RepID=A0ABU5T6M0_9MICC|nr:DUF4870 domain-containing protein [Sinomonas sp. JGH33]MEA5455325.1 DUF4870 domain-containing protein [Sinomonas sp. JGH33]
MSQNWQDEPEHRSGHLGNVGGTEPFTSSEDRQWATIAHFGGILGCIPSLLVYLAFRNRGPFTAQESKEALNFTLPPTLAALALNLLALIPVVGSFFAVLATLVWLALAIMSVSAGIEVNRGQPFRYRYNLRWIK